MKTIEFEDESLEQLNDIVKLDDIDIVTDEEIENAMRPLTHEEKMERLRQAEEDPVYYTHEEIIQMVTSWRMID